MIDTRRWAVLLRGRLSKAQVLKCHWAIQRDIAIGLPSFNNVYGLPWSGNRKMRWHHQIKEKFLDLSPDSNGMEMASLRLLRYLFLGRAYVGEKLVMPYVACLTQDVCEAVCQMEQRVTSCFPISVHSVINIIIILAGAIALIIGFGISGMCYPITVHALPISVKNSFTHCDIWEQYFSPGKLQSRALTLSTVSSLPETFISLDFSPF